MRLEWCFSCKCTKCGFFGFTEAVLNGVLESCLKEGCWDELLWTPCLWSQWGNWEQNGDESGTLLMGAFCRRGGGADMSMRGCRNMDAPPLQGDETWHPYPDGGIERDLFALPPRQIHPLSLFFPLFTVIILFFNLKAWTRLVLKRLLKLKKKMFNHLIIHLIFTFD